MILQADLPGSKRSTGCQVAAGRFVTVIIPHFNDLDGLRLCYGRLMSQTYPRNEFEIVVADNNSACGLQAIQAIVPEARVIPAPVQGAGAARNAGVAASRGEILAFLDSDCVPEADWLAEGVIALGDYDFVGGQVVTFAHQPERPNAIEAYEIVFNFNFRRYIQEVGFTGTGNMFVTRQVFDRVGGFRTGVSEDIDWSFRARTLGFRLGYAGRAVVGHPARRSWAELKRRWARIVLEHYALAQEKRYGRTMFALKALAMPASVLVHSAKVAMSPRLSGVVAKAGAVSVLGRLRIWRAGRMLRLALGGVRPSSPGSKSTAGA